MSEIGFRGWSDMARDGEVVPVDPQAVVAVKKKSSRSWVLLDCTGKATVLDVDKYAIMHRVHIHARDLRIVDPLLSYPSTILGRDRAIVLNLEVLSSFQFSILLFWFLKVFWLLCFCCCCQLNWVCLYLGSQHIKAIITAEEVSLSLSLSK